MNCRFCDAKLPRPFLDLGFAPPSNNYLTAKCLSRPEIAYPLRLRVCESCWLVQTEDYASSSDLFRDDYAYYSSASKTWRDHCATFAEQVSNELELNSDSFVVEIASNDGCLIKNFVARNVPSLGIEPTLGTANKSRQQGVQTIQEFFSTELAAKIINKYGFADLIMANNVFAHVPNINDFTNGLAVLLGNGGIISIEIPHLLELFRGTQFDTVYHEHFSYLSVTTIEKIFKKHGLRLFNVEKIPTHGGSIRVYACKETDLRKTSNSVDQIKLEEANFRLFSKETYLQFQDKIVDIKHSFLSFVLRCKSERKVVAAYGAAAKGNTFLNFCGVNQDLISCVFDVAPSKQGLFLPGSHIPIKAPSEINLVKPDILIILPWNIASEVIEQQQCIRSWGGKFYIATPEVREMKCIS